MTTVDDIIADIEHTFFDLTTSAEKLVQYIDAKYGHLYKAILQASSTRPDGFDATLLIQPLNSTKTFSIKQTVGDRLIIKR